MDDLDKMARELLAAELRRRGLGAVARAVVNGSYDDEPEHSAIRTALLTAPPGYVLADRAQLESALESVRAAMDAAYRRRFPECCGSYSPSGCCGNPREAWTKEDHETMDALHPAEQALVAMIVAAPRPA